MTNGTKTKQPSRISQCFRTAFDFMIERDRVLQNVGNTGGFWEATTEIATFQADYAENDPLLVDLLAVCVDELERQARTMERKRGGLR